MAHQAKTTLKVQCTLPSPLYNTLMIHADQQGYSKHGLVREALRQFGLKVREQHQAQLMARLTKSNSLN